MFKSWFLYFSVILYLFLKFFVSRFQKRESLTKQGQFWLFGFNLLPLEDLFGLQSIQALNEFNFLLFRCFSLFLPVFQKSNFFGEFRLKRIEFVLLLCKNEMDHWLKFDKVFGANFFCDFFVSLNDWLESVDLIFQKFYLGHKIGQFGV